MPTNKSRPGSGALSNCFRRARSGRREREAGLPPLQFVTLEKLPSPVKLTRAAFAGV